MPFPGPVCLTADVKKVYPCTLPGEFDLIGRSIRRAIVNDEYMRLRVK